MKKACDVQPGDRTGEWMAVESRPYLANPEVMWLIFWRRWGIYRAGPGMRIEDSSYVPRDMPIEIQHEAYEITELP